MSTTQTPQHYSTSNYLLWQHFQLHYPKYAS